MRVLAVDIGGSKIDILYHDGFKTLFKRFSWGLKHRDLSKSVFNNRFNKLMKHILAEYAFDQVVFSVAGLDSHEDWIFWRGKLDQHVKDRYILVHDVKAALYTATLGLDGIVVIIGTGCNVYGEYGDRAYYSGDWGWRYGDDFSGYRASRDFINIILRMYDGRRRKLKLYDTFLEYIGIEEGELIPYLYSLSVEDIAGLTGFMCRYYSSRIIKSIFNKLLEEAYNAILAVVRRIGSNLSVNYTGGLFRCAQFRQDLVNYLCNRGLEVGEYVKYPIVGGLLIPYIEAGYTREYLVSLKEDLISYIESMGEYI